jgi:hypothetical protein
MSSREDVLGMAEVRALKAASRTQRMERFVRLHKSGMTDPEIAEAMEMNPQSVRNQRRKLGLPGNKARWYR